MRLHGRSRRFSSYHLSSSLRNPCMDLLPSKSHQMSELAILSTRASTPQLPCCVATPVGESRSKQYGFLCASIVSTSFLISCAGRLRWWRWWFPNTNAWVKPAQQSASTLRKRQLWNRPIGRSCGDFRRPGPDRRGNRHYGTSAVLFTCAECAKPRRQRSHWSRISFKHRRRDEPRIQ